jgi:DNA topoisomerase IB
MSTRRAGRESGGSLRYVTDAEPGIRRRRRRRGGEFHFSYVDPRGAAVRDEATLARIRSLAIPPAYEDVWICAHADGHMQATGRDARGRKQYRYHRLWRSRRDDQKHARMHEFGRALPRLRRALRADLSRRGLPRDKVLALVISLMDATCVRVGNEGYARSNGSFGLSTLLDRHARVRREGAGTLRFPGKGGTLHEVDVRDTRLAALVRRCQHLPGQHLFQYVDEAGGVHAIDSGQVNDYLRRHMAGDFTAKDFRTWHATLHACQLLLRVPRPDPCTDAACRRAMSEVVDAVAAQLRNTPTVCRKSYINPLVLEAWQQGRAPFTGGVRGGAQALLALLRRSGATGKPRAMGRALSARAYGPPAAASATRRDPVRRRPAVPAPRRVHPHRRAWAGTPRTASSARP